MWHKKIFILYLLLFGLNSYAQNLHVYVYDEITKEKLPYTYIFYLNNAQTQYAKVQESGFAELKKVQYPLVLSCKMLGYIQKEKTINSNDIKHKNNQEYISIYLQKSPREIKELVVTAQNKPMLAQQAIYKIQTITQKEIAQKGALFLNDILKNELNFFVANDAQLGSSANIGGITGNNIKILQNGVPISGRLNGNIDLSQINLTNVKRIEILKGPMSSIYGADAMGGVINLITNQTTKKITTGIHFFTESIHKYNVHTFIGYSNTKQQLLLNAGRNFFAGWNSAPPTAQRVKEWKPRTQYTADLQYNYNLSKKTKLNYYGTYLNDEIINRGNPTIDAFAAYAFDEYYKTQRHTHTFTATTQINTTDEISITGNYANYNRKKNKYIKDLVSLKQILTEGVGDQDTSIFKNYFAKAVYTSSRVKNVQLLAGIDMEIEHGKSTRLKNNNQQFNNLATYITSNFHYKKWIAQPALRLTINNKYRIPLIPALHLKYDIDSSTTLRASFAKGYRTPTIKELYLYYYDSNHFIEGNEMLKPEKGYHIEASVDKKINIRKANYLQASYTTAYNNLNNLITLSQLNQTVYNHYIYQNIENYKNIQYTANAKYVSVRTTLSGGVSITQLLKTQTVPANKYLEANCNVAYLIPKVNINTSINYKYNSKQPILQTSAGSLTAFDAYTKPIHYIDASIQKSVFNQHLSLQIGVKNLANVINTSVTNSQGNAVQTVHNTSSYTALLPGRSYYADIRYRF